LAHVQNLTDDSKDKSRGNLLLIDGKFMNGDITRQAFPMNPTEGMLPLVWMVKDEEKFFNK
jgi:hypothetical protein